MGGLGVFEYYDTNPTQVTVHGNMHACMLVIFFFLPAAGVYAYRPRNLPLIILQSIVSFVRVPSSLQTTRGQGNRMERNPSNLA